jgi:hypothetical protein
VSYARFGSDGSDVYVFFSDDGLECCGSPAPRRAARRRFPRRRLRRDVYHHVPNDVPLLLLEADRERNDREMTEARR